MLVKHHLLFPDRLETGASIRRMLRRVGTDGIGDLLDLRRADYASRSADGLAPADWTAAEARIRAELEAHADPELALGGDDVMRALDLLPGHEVGRWLKALRRHIVEHPADNTRTALLDWLATATDEEDA
jgi:hypothetical protein